MKMIKQLNNGKNRDIMKQLVIFLAIAAFLAACSAKPADESALKLEQLQLYKTQLSELKQKIDVLEQELALNDKTDHVKVQVTELRPELFEHFIEVTGRVEAEEDVQVSPESGGVIEEVLVKEGQYVSRGQTMAILNTETLKRALDELKIQYGLATTTYERQKNLWDQNIGSEMQLLQAKSSMEALLKRIESTEAQMNLAVVKSPVSGIIDAVYQKKGEIGSPQIPFARVINSSSIRIYADISESYLPKIAKGDKVNVFFPALGKETEAVVNLIGNSINPNNRTFSIRINISNPDGMIRPNLISTIRLRDYISTEAIVVPNILIKEDFTGRYTYIAEETEGKTVARKVYVVPGINSNNLTEVKEGLTSGMKIISEGYVQVADGTPVQIQG
jgi:membrane fusion protein, multidrug efflux system